jgi:hypothetical protein
VSQPVPDAAMIKRSSGPIAEIAGKVGNAALTASVTTLVQFLAQGLAG